MSCEIQPARHNHQSIHQQGTKWAGPKWTKKANFGQKILIFPGEIKSFVTHIMENHLGTLFALFFGRALKKRAKNANIWPKMPIFDQKCQYLTKNAYSRPIFRPILDNPAQFHQQSLFNHINRPWIDLSRPPKTSNDLQRPPMTPNNLKWPSMTYFWLFLFFLAISCFFWLCLATCGYFWLFLAVSVCFWLFLIISDYKTRHRDGGRRGGGIAVKIFLSKLQLWFFFLNCYWYK